MKKTIIYTIVGVLPPVITLLLLPVFLKYLSTNEFVILSLSNSFLAIFSVVLNFKVDQAFRTIYFYETDNAKKQLSMFRTLFSFQLILFLFWIVVFYFFGNSLFELLFKNDIAFFPYTFILLLSFLIGALSNMYFIYLQNKLEVIKYSLYFIANAFLTPVLQLLCIFYFKLDFKWFLLSTLCSNLVVFLLIYFNNLSLFKIEFSKAILKEALKFSLPFIPFLIYYTIENQMDRFFIEKFLSLEELARYAVLLSVSSAIFTLFNSLDNAIRPELFALISKKAVNMKLEIQKKMDFYLLMGLLSLSFLVVFGTNIQWFLNNEKYNGITIYFPLIAIAFSPLLLLRFLALLLIYENKISAVNYFSLAKIMLMSILFFIFIPIYKINGALITIGISNVLNVFIFYKIIQTKVFPSKKILFYMLLFILTCSIMIVFKQTKFVSLIAVCQFLCFVLLFLANYKNDVKIQWQELINTKP